MDLQAISKTKKEKEMTVGEPIGHAIRGSAGMADRRSYWWAWKLHKGQPVRRGPYNDEFEANERGMMELGGDFQVVRLPTRDSAKAKGMIAEIILRQAGNLDLALKRQRRLPVENWDKEEQETD